MELKSSAVVHCNIKPMRMGGKFNGANNIST